MSKFQKVEQQVVSDQYAMENVKLIMQIEMQKDPNLDYNSAYQLAVKQTNKEIIES